MEEVSTDITLFPNPASNFFQVKGLENHEEDVAYLIHDLAGRTVQNATISASNNAIDVSNLANGMYLFTSFLNGEKITKKFTVSQ